ncbi:DoxX-like family protein [Psychrobacter sp. I-STPA10]|uniref:DoxX-like family protein n=1 Tax=Psychrobacter sp. I-STPA10 TaxID=2585769 RepID=UPI001E452DDE|nr:DoxX-like family protein [Psychrobacter sp. I-STPA10]
MDNLSIQHTQTYSPLMLPNYLYLSLAVLWAYSGIMPVLFAPTESLAMLAKLGIAESLQWGIFLFASVLDVAFAILIISRCRYQAWLWLAQFVVVASYSIIVAVGLPENWTHPFAPLIKNVPIMALLFYLYQRHKH